jgi:arylsulfatase A-like enzyme
VILADDLGNADLGYRGSDIKTPNIDKLAREGVRMESFHGMPVCTPSRAALMTGRHPMRYGLQTLAIFSNHTCPLPLVQGLMEQLVNCTAILQTLSPFASRGQRALDRIQIVGSGGA